MFTNITAWFRKPKSMLNPLILTQAEFEARAAEFASFTDHLSQACVPTMDAKAFTERIRKIILDEMKIVGRDNPGFPNSPVWGPTVKSDSAATQYFLLVTGGTEDQYQTTDGVRVRPPPLPLRAPSIEPMGVGPHGSNLPGIDAQGSGGGSPYFSREDGHIDPRLINAAIIQERLEEAKLSAQVTAKASEGKLYRVSGLTEVTAEEVQAEMGRKRKKPVTYIRGTIVEPKLRVEI